MGPTPVFLFEAPSQRIEDSMKFLSITFALLILALAATGAEARRHPGHRAAPEICQSDIMRPCGGWFFGQEPANLAQRHGPVASRGYRSSAGKVVGHPPGCPRRAFCGCGAAVRVFGSPVRSLWLAAAWLRFPRAAPAPGMVAARRGHVFVLESHLGGNTWLAYDANSGGHATRIHPRSIAGYAIVNPRA